MLRQRRSPLAEVAVHERLGLALLHELRRGPESGARGAGLFKPQRRADSMMKLQIAEADIRAELPHPLGDGRNRHAGCDLGNANRSQAGIAAG